MVTLRGLVCGLTLPQVAQRARYLAGLATIDTLDWYVRKEDAPLECPVGYYLLKDHNGGKDPTAPDPFARWFEDDDKGNPHERRTADCMGGAAWCGGFDRYQPRRFAHLYSGWINTDSMLLDAHGRMKCFEGLDQPQVGAFIVCKSGSPGHAIGHIGVVVETPPEWDRRERECWKALGVVDVASTGAGKRANTLRTGVGWYGANASFVKSTMRG
jgi:hypothetical protein